MTDPSTCCHGSRELHLSDAALVATLLLEHDLVDTIVDHPSDVAGLLAAHSAAAAALVAWKRAGDGP